MKFSFFVALLCFNASLVVASDSVKAIPIILFVDEPSVAIRSVNSFDGVKLGSFQKDSELHLHNFGEKWHFVSGINSGHYIRGWMWAKYLKGDFTNPPILANKSGPIDLQGRAFPPSQVRAAKEAIVQRDLEARGQECSCPYQISKSGRQCGYTSAWTKWSGERPICFSTDVSLADLDNYFALNATNN
ncbi:hypothetical protein [Cognatishimia activa]|uniref:Bacterial SH3 domain protein n=1 Tax=Cognatishimia activa TaxID=1715691 RepID=A0A975EMV6_9RHOB|nr:hypothetical protein [Cognatishimia activa]QTN34949.1 hypothetical protein HZ995_10630 [Cognatishimia activa]